MIEITLLGVLQGAGQEQRQETQTKALESIPDKIQDNELLWVDAESPTKEEIKNLQRRFNLDSFAVEDVILGKQRSKIEEYKGNNFSVLHVPVLTGSAEQQKKKKERKKPSEFGITELYIFFGDRWVITIHKEDAEIIHDVEKRVTARGLAPLTNSPSPDLL